ncbi:Flavonol 3-O-glucosyltransferase [Bertholletia excelsa]
MFNSMIEIERRSYGIIFGSFYELEPNYIDHFKKSAKVNCWSLGLLPLFTNRGKIRNGNNSKMERHHCLSWLDTQKPNSVLYACFGSMVQLSDSQLTRIALGLESAGYPFVWVVRKEGKGEENWLLKGFEERIVKCNKGVIIRSWAPQVQILDHLAIAVFLSHGGGNSVIECATAGLPLILWPMYAEHFYNSKLVTRVLKIGVEIGPRVWNATFDLTSTVVEEEEFVKAIKFLMGGSDEAKQMRQRVKDLGIKAKKAVEEGGSSDRDLTAIIEDLKRHTFG